jgi:hypothetical protein
MKKMGDITSGEGRTILFVSHNLASVQRLCARGLYLEAGRLKVDGPIFQALDAYQRSFEQPTENAVEPPALPEGSARFLRWRLENSSVGEPHTCQTRETCTFVLTLASRLSLEDGGMSFIIWNLEGGLVLHGNLWEEKFPPFALRYGRYEFRIRVRLPIKAGLYQVDARLYSKTRGPLESALLEPKLHVLHGEITSLPQWQAMVTEQLEFAVAPVP